MAILNPTLACADPLHLARDLDALERGGAGMLHVDVMDGHYVPNLCLSFDQAAANGLGKLCQRRFEILHPASSQLLIPCVTLPYCAQKAQRLRRGATIANCGHAARVAASCIIFRPLPPLAKSTLGTAAQQRGGSEGTSGDQPVIWATMESSRIFVPHKLLS